MKTSKAKWMPKVELEQVKGNYIRAVNDLKLISEKNKALDENNGRLYEDVQDLIQELGEQKEVQQYQASKKDFLNVEIDRLTIELTILGTKRFVEQVAIKQDLEMSQDHIRQQAQRIEELKVELLVASRRNTEILAQLDQALAERDQALADVEAEVAQTMLKSEHITWNVRKFTLEQTRYGISDLNDKIFEANVVEDGPSVD
ncbi:hypothetical protein K7X08_036662 [Anisodus acutangulus]|uniref:Uncharacterized protein n=1 Tax=Anisodus acutangulus TaxID=402998 RepID=A0A9Q1QYA0_9SOLA|nr:hypothetical protein K7X08_036662 [Anisodus acutangulus]